MINFERIRIINKYTNELKEKIKETMRSYNKEYQFDLSYIEDFKLRFDVLKHYIASYKSRYPFDKGEMSYHMPYLDFKDYMFEDKTPRKSFYDSERDCFFVSHPYDETEFRVFRDKATLSIIKRLEKSEDDEDDSGHYGKSGIDPYDRGGLLMNR